MQARRVEPAEVLDDRQLQLVTRAPDAIADQLGLDRVDERLGQGVVVGVADGSERSEHARVIQHLCELDARVFGETARAAGIAVSMGARGCALDNAVCEAFFATLKKELTRRRSWPTRRELQTAVFAWIEGWYGCRRLHSTLGYLSPAHYENRTLTEPGAGLAASRLAHTSEMIKEKAA